MCGIVGYIGSNQALDILLDGLTRLEYRGYDSAGIAALQNGSLRVVKSQGRLQNLVSKLQTAGLQGHIGIGHTRWATHGAPSDANAHPHLSQSGSIALVHNGIIENEARLRKELVGKGYAFHSQTDTETIAHLLEETYANGDPCDPMTALRDTLRRLEGAYALAVLFRDAPDRILVARKDSPLIIGIGEDGCTIASDIPALLPYTRRVILLQEGDVAQVFADRVEIFGKDLRPVRREPTEITWSAQAAERGGYAHFMRKEIHDQPRALRDTLSPRVQNGRIDLTQAGLTDDLLRATRRVVITACGTACHAGHIGRALIEKLCRVPVDVDVASEFRYRDPILRPDDLFIVVSQSGETADTLAALRLAKARGCNRVLAITNVVGSTIAREADGVLYTWAGPEIAVASTKAFTTQALCFYLIALQMALVKGKIAQAQFHAYLKELTALPEKAELLLSDTLRIEQMAQRLHAQPDVFFIGRGLDHALCMEASLKLKEITYIHSEAIPAGELKHGAIALLTQGTPVVALCTQSATRDKLRSNLREVLARGADVLLIGGQEGMGEDLTPHHLPLPETDDLFAPLLAVLPAQLLAYFCAINRGCDPDKPRNLAKSVTVE